MRGDRGDSGRQPPKTLLLSVWVVPSWGCPGWWTLLLVRAAGTGEGSRALHLEVAF